MKYKNLLWDMLKEIDDVDDPSFEFLNGCLSYCLDKNGLTVKQRKVVDKYVDKYAYLWESQSYCVEREEGKSHAIN